MTRERYVYNFNFVRIFLHIYFSYSQLYLYLIAIEKFFYNKKCESVFTRDHMILIGIIITTSVAILNMHFKADVASFVGIIMVNYLVLFLRYDE